ncbi:MAG TPA: hypothetical protein VEJ47_01355 [Candidatus Eremiobacteraceae bacterium]|nr:hypothetical protein [Candidatus Eremiobacteraceae bacterium]
MNFILKVAQVVVLCCVTTLAFGGMAVAQSSDADRAPKHKQLSWAPPDVNAPLPSLASTPPCDLSKVLQDAGARAEELTANLENFTAEEKIEYQRLDRNGAWEEGDSSVFDYVFAFEETGKGRGTREYRTPAKGGHNFPASGQDTGEAALALIFLPTMQTDYQMSCEGLDKWNGQPAWVVHFVQRRGKPARTFQLRATKGVYGVLLAGRAWISIDNAQVLHLETNIMQTIPAINLYGGATSIDYAPVRIASRKLELWLPERIEAYWEIGDRRTMLYHTFSDFRVFSVEIQENVEKPKEQ